MKKIMTIVSLCLLSLLVACTCGKTVRADSIPSVDLSRVQEMIQQKEDFYLLISRSDAWKAGPTVARVQEISPIATKPIYHLRTEHINAVAYKKFATKYRIRSVLYLAHFAQKKQMDRLPNLEQQLESDLVYFLSQ